MVRSILGDRALTTSSNEARFLMTRTPVSLHSDPAIINAASLLKALYSCSYPAIYSHLAAPTWDPVLTGLRDRFAEIFRRRTCSLLSSAYTSISPESVSYYLGIEASPASSAQPWFVQGGWKTDGAGMFIPPSPSSREGMTRKKDNDTRISRLTALVTHLTEG